MGDPAHIGPPSLERAVSSSTPGGRRSLATCSVVTDSTLGVDISVAVPDEQIRELQCAACGELVQTPIYAPCGHSFCQKHIDSNVEDDEIDRMAEILRRLCGELNFPAARAREALAASPRDMARAEELCRAASSIEGRVVRVRPDVKDPQFDWGKVTTTSIGRVQGVDGNHARVDFPEQNRWHCLTSEIKIDEVADSVRVGTRVRVRQGVKPSLGWGTLEGDLSGEVVRLFKSRVLVQGLTKMWFGFIGEVEPVPEAEEWREEEEEGVTEEVWQSRLQKTLARFAASEPSEACRGYLAGILRVAVDAQRDAGALEKARRVMLRGECRRAILCTQGSMDTLRLVGFRIRKLDRERSRCLIESTHHDFPRRSQAVLAALESKFGISPSAPTDDDMRYTVLLTVDEKTARKAPFDAYWDSTLKPKLLPALFPPQGVHSWLRRGWQDEEELKKSLNTSMLSGPTPVARGQSRKDSKQISSSLEAQGLVVSVEEAFKAEGEDPLLAEDPVDIMPLDAWQGSVAKGTRVRLVNLPEDHPLKKVASDSVGVVGGQYMSSTEGLKLLINFNTPTSPGVASGHVTTDLIEEDVLASTIQPGVRVKVRSGVDPVLGMQGIDSSDIGIVHSVDFDGLVNVYVPTIEDFFIATLKELDTQEVPKTVKGNCPVCQEPLLCGERLAIDMAVEAQVRRLHRLMAGERKEKNEPIGVAREKSLMRTMTHKEELTCSICMDLMVSPVTLGCGHSFCKAHIEAWLLQNPRCPNCKHRVLPERLHKRQAKAPKRALFDIELHDDEETTSASGDGAGTQAQQPQQSQSQQGSAVDWPDFSINKMLESQLVRYFPKEIESRTSEMASEVWAAIQERSAGYLGRLRAFVRQNDRKAIIGLADQGLASIDMKLPGTHGGTLIMLAAEQGMAGAVEELLKMQADPLCIANAGSDVGVSALSLAAARGHSSTVEVLLQAATWPATRLADALAAALEQRQEECVSSLLSNSEGLVQLPNSVGFPAMLTAVQTNCAKFVPRLLEGRANLETTLESGMLVSGAGIEAINGVFQVVGEYEGRYVYQNPRGAIMYCKQWWKISDARSGLGAGWYYSMPEPRSEVSQPPGGLWTTFGYDGSGQNALPAPTVERLGGGEAGGSLTPLVLAVQLGFVDVAKKLINAQADLTMRVPGKGESVLQVACARGDVGMVRVLIRGGGLTKCPSSQGGSPLHAACAAGHHLVVTELLEVGVLAESEEAPTPLMMAACGGRFPPGLNRLWSASVAKKYLSVVEELLKAKARVDTATEKGESVLHLAAMAGASEGALDALVASGGDVTARTADGRTPFMAALLAGRSSAAMGLLKFLRPVSTAFRSNHNGLTPLAAACLLGDASLVEMMLQLAAEEDPGLPSQILLPLDRAQPQPRCVRLVVHEPEHLSQLVDEPWTSCGSGDPAEPGSLKPGDYVTLSVDYTARGHAGKGPLKPGNVGKVLKRDNGKVPYQVEFKSHTFWYREGALRKYEVLVPDMSSVREWSGQCLHPYIDNGRTLGIRIQVFSPSTGYWHFHDQSEPIAMEVLSADGTVVFKSETLELRGKFTDAGTIRGKVVKLAHQSGNFVLMPSRQDGTIRCAASHPTQRMTAYSQRSATCDICRRSIQAQEPLFFTCLQCDYDVCSACCGGSPLLRLPVDQPVTLGDWSPLHFAAAAGNAKVTQVLLDARADLHAKTCIGRTALHCAAAAGQGWAVEVLLERDPPQHPSLPTTGNGGASSSRGPVSAPAEVSESGNSETDAGSVAGSLDEDIAEAGIAGVTDVHGLMPLALAPYEMLRYACSPGELQGQCIEVGRAAAGAPGEPAAAGIYKIHALRDGKPSYRKDGNVGWTIYWDKLTSRWGIYQESLDAGNIQYQRKSSSDRCPSTGWEAVIAPDPVPAFEEVLPWRAGTNLLAATPRRFQPKPHDLKKAVDGLKKNHVQLSAVTISIVDAQSGITVGLPPGAPSVEVLIEEMIRRGDLPPEPPSGCLQQ